MRSRDWWRRYQYSPAGGHPARCTSTVFEQGFPKYAWGWLGGHLYEARHINGPAGTYKGYQLTESGYPRDPEHLLDWGSGE